jgi:hypothetical protein
MNYLDVFPNPCIYVLEVGNRVGIGENLEVKICRKESGLKDMPGSIIEWLIGSVARARKRFFTSSIRRQEKSSKPRPAGSTPTT